jgi:hypothetical protein
MNINTDINILGGLPDWNLVLLFLSRNIDSMRQEGGVNAFTSIKTDKSVVRFEKAITATLLKPLNFNIEFLIRDTLQAEGISKDSLHLLFWNASFNSDLFRYLNEHVYFVSFFSGRITIKPDEVAACLKDLRERESELKAWSDYTLEKNASKYLTLLKKFNLMEGSQKKTILHPYLNDKMFVLFIYWLKAVEEKSNLLESEWLKYSFCERPIFIERLLQKKFSNYYQLQYSGDKLKIETLIPYENIYHAIR